MLMLPEIIVILTAFAVLVTDLLIAERRRVVLAPLTITGLAAALAALLCLPAAGQLLGGRYALDAPGWWFKVAFLLAALVTVVLSMHLLDGRAAVRVRGIGSRAEYYAVLLSSLCGMMYLVSSRDLVALYVSLELATIPLFALAAWQRENVASGEAGLKYVIIGALSSAFVLYGMGLLYGLTGHTDLAAISRSLHPSPALWLAGAMLLAGVGFKMTIVPFHMWAPDVYHGAPVPVTAYLSVASKGAGLAFMFQLFFRTMGQYLGDGLFVVAFFAAATMTVGNVVAIVQQNIKRFMAFSAISQAGYILMGFLGPSPDGPPAMIFYLLIYVVTNLGAFLCIVWYANQTGRENISDYRGLSRTNPLMALGMMIALFSLAGIPPLSGFVGKFFLFKIASNAGLHWLVALAAINSTISLYYYLRIVRQMYIEPTFENAAPIPVPRPLGVTMLLLTLAAALMGIIPQLYESIHHSTGSWLSAVVH